MLQIIDYHNFNPSLSFKTNFLAKDFSAKSIIKHKPFLESIIDEISQKMTAKRYLTVDYMEKNLNKGVSTCVRPIWHVDGNNNNYALICVGDFKTLFLNDEVSFERKASIKETSDYLDEMVKKDKLNFFELATNQLALYDSNHIHSGQVATYKTKRILLRLCYSDYIKPANKLL
jgi:hypothetical protein